MSSAPLVLHDSFTWGCFFCFFCAHSAVCGSAHTSPSTPTLLSSTNHSVCTADCGAREVLPRHTQHRPGRPADSRAMSAFITALLWCELWAPEGIAMGQKKTHPSCRTRSPNIVSLRETWSISTATVILVLTDSEPAGQRYCIKEAHQVRWNRFSLAVRHSEFNFHFPNVLNAA